MGAVTAYFGETFIAQAAPDPAIGWRILRHPNPRMQDQGEFVLLGPAHISRKRPRDWVVPHAVTGVLTSSQLYQPESVLSQPFWLDGPQGLRKLLFMRLQEFGETVPDLPTPQPDPEPEHDPEGTLAALLDAGPPPRP